MLTTPNLALKKPEANDTVNIADLNYNADILDQEVAKRLINTGGVPSIQAGLDAEKPTPGTAGRLYVATDTQIIYRDTGTAWQKVGAVKWGDIEGKPSSFTPSIHGNEAHEPDLALASDLAAHLADKVHIGNNPSAFVYSTVNQSIPNSTATILTFDTEVFDNDNMYDPASNTRLTVRTAGKYLIIAHVVFDINSSYTRHVALRKNGNTYLSYVKANACSVGTTRIQCLAIANLNVNEYVDVVVYQDSGVSLNSLATDGGPYFGMVKVG